MNETGKSRSDERLRRSDSEAPGFLFGLPASVLEAFAAAGHVALYPRTSILFAREQEPRGIYIICSGRVKLSLSSRDGSALTLRLAKPGEVLALADVLLGKDSQVTAEALYSCEIKFIARTEFMRILSMHPDVFKNVARQLALQYEAVCEQMRTVALGLSVRAKFSRFLLHWIAENQQSDEFGAVPLPLSQGEIGACIGATREAVARTFRKFKSAGLVERQGYIWVIPRPALIRRFSISEAGSQEVGSLTFYRREVTHGRVRPARLNQVRREANGWRG